MTNPLQSASYAFVDRKVGELLVDPKLQRDLKKSRVDKMAADFQPNALGMLTTSFRGEGQIHVVDGQHRLRAAEAAGYTGTLTTKEYHGLTPAQEAALFRLLNQTEKVNPIDQFLVAVVEGRPAAVHLSRILSDNGWALAPTARKGHLSAVRSLERVYDLSPEAAGAAIAVLTAAYGHQPAAVQGPMVEGVGRMLAKYLGQVNLDDLAKRLASVPGGPDGLVGHARGQQLTRSGNLSIQLARIVTNVYNQRRRTSALPEWQ